MQKISNVKQVETTYKEQIFKSWKISAISEEGEAWVYSLSTQDFEDLLATYGYKDPIQFKGKEVIRSKFNAYKRCCFLVLR